jgi:sugar diacid utilization regulator
MSGLRRQPADDAAVDPGPRRRELHVRIVDAVLEGDRPERVAALLAEAGLQGDVAPLVELAADEARREAEQALRGSLLEELRSRADLDPGDVVRRARRLGCDLSGGAVALSVELAADGEEAVERAVETIVRAHPGALAQRVQERRVDAILPAPAGEDGIATEAATLAAARRLALRLQSSGVAATSTFHADPARLRRALQEAELVLEVLLRDGGAVAEDVARGTYRLLFRVLASHPEELRAFYEDTAAPIVRYDARHESELVRTLEAYLAQDCNVNATAAAIGAHRHTVAHRLERIKELTRLDPLRTEDRERLGLGLKAHRILTSASPPRPVR